MALPDLFHAACHMTGVLDWHIHGPLKQWIQIEWTLAKFPLDSVLWCQSGLPTSVLDHPTVGKTWRTCFKISSTSHIAQMTSPLTHIVGNPAFSSGVYDPSFQSLLSTVIFQARHFIVKGCWTGFSRLQIMDCLSFASLQFWQKLQLVNFIRSLPAPDAFRWSLT